MYCCGDYRSTKYCPDCGTEIGMHTAKKSLLKYLENIVENRYKAKYRQLRIAGKNFSPIWQSPLRGLLLALGFVDVGMYAEFGCSNKPLSSERVQDVALLTYQLKQWQKKENEYHGSSGVSSSQQPDGADGFGRAGYGRAGTIN